MSFWESIDGQARKIGPLEERATLLGYIGLAPFLFAALVLWTCPARIGYTAASAVMLWTMYYAAIVLSFLGGIRWGLALLNDKKISEYVTLSQLSWSVLPALGAWLVVIPDGAIPGISPNYLTRYFFILIAFITLMYTDLQATRDGFAPEWYGPMRLKLTFFTGLAIMLIMIKLFLFGW